ncbi:hypothetical protein GCM10011581_44030 [Saccharopolyspora subtropica]|uniref:Uncharacterized protein n=1 Tax=Saccharopolyspora thermophila TaxID=89367 RepID=A0A917K5T3_9PSEU|nr:hypothetical protein GCM10011581_44030 [Saccharopolyspora subtropica]
MVTQLDGHAAALRAELEPGTSVRTTHRARPAIFSPQWTMLSADGVAGTRLLLRAAHGVPGPRPAGAE